MLVEMQQQSRPTLICGLIFAKVKQRSATCSLNLVTDQAEAGEGWVQQPSRDGATLLGEVRLGRPSEHEEK